MSQLIKQSHASVAQPLWTAYSSGGGGSTGPTGPAGPTGATGSTGPTGAGATTASQTFQDQQTDGTPGGTSPGFIGAYGVRVLNTGIPALSGSNSTAITGMSLSSNQITCPAGTYTVAGSCPGIACGRHRCRLYNVTDSNVMVQGQNNFEYNGGYEGGATNLNGTFVLTGTKTIQLEHQVENSATVITAPDDVTLGLACGFGDTEVYSQITFTKIG
jgi:hypothetical protein